MHEVPVLALEAEYRLRDLLTPPDDGRFEASGVTAARGWLWVVFDNTRRVARLPLVLDGSRGTWIELGGAADGFEDIAYSARAGRFLLLVETVKRGSSYVSAIDEYDERWRFIGRGLIEGVLLRRNKGYEGLACATLGGRERVLALRERDRRRQAGIDLLERTSAGWRVSSRLVLPPRAGFSDYAALDLRGNRLAVLSQEDARVWIGRVDARRLALTEGLVVDFPRSRKKHKRRYYTLEGIAWLSDNRAVVVSDRAKRRLYPRRARRRDESIHLFRLPKREPVPLFPTPRDGC